MIVKVSDYGDCGNKKFVEYNVSDLSSNQLKYLHENLDEKTVIDEDILKITMFFEPEVYPFQSEVSKIRLNDFIAREEIEMNVFLSSFLQDM